MTVKHSLDKAGQKPVRIRNASVGKYVRAGPPTERQAEEALDAIITVVIERNRQALKELEKY